MLPLQVTLFTMSKHLSPAVEDCHQLEQELTHFQMLQIPNTQSFDPAQLSELCTTAFSSTDSTVLQSQPDSALTVDK